MVKKVTPSRDACMEAFKIMLPTLIELAKKKNEKVS